MTQIPRRSPKEFTFVLKQSGVTKVLLVEGFADRNFFRWVLSAGEIDALAVHAISEIEVPREWLGRDLEMSSNRDLVVAACRAAIDGASFSGLSVRGVIDRDCGVPEAWSTLHAVLLTDFPAIESYCFTQRTLGKWLLITLRGQEGVSGAKIVEEISPVLRGLFHVRSSTGGLGASVDKVLTYKSGTWSADFPDADRNGAYHAGLLSETGGDPRETCYGHDLASVLMVRFGNSVKNGAGLRTPDAVERSLLSTVDLQEIAVQPLFAELVDWIAAA